MPAVLKFEMILSALLTRFGYSGFFLIKSKNKYYEKIVSVNPNCNILVFDDFIKAKDVSDSEKKSKKIINDLKIKNKQVEKQILSSTLRKLRKGKINIKSDYDLKILFEDLIEYHLALKVSDKLFNKYNFDFLIINEKGYSPASEFFNIFIKNKKKVIQWVSSVNDDAFVFKKYNYKNKLLHPFSLDDETWKSYVKNKWSKDKNDQILSQIRNFYTDGNWFNRQDLNKNKFYFKKDILKKLSIDKSKKTAVIFSYFL